MDVQTILIAVISSGVVGSLLLFVQFLIQRHDSRQDKNSEVLTAIKNLNTKITGLDEKVDQVDSKGDERFAVSTRVRILRFEDEMQEGKRHSKDSWDQTISDCDFYNSYCESHPKFKNGQTEATVRHIRHGYDERLEKGDWK